MGSALFFLYALPRGGPGSAAALTWPRPALAAAALLLLIATVCGLLVQTALLAGSWAEGMEAASLEAVLGLDLGKAAAARAEIAAVALGLALAARSPTRALWLALGGLGTGAAVTIGWMGHGGASEGAGAWVHLAADMLHVVAAGIWLGALVVFVILFAAPNEKEPVEALDRALRRFSGVGSLLVGVLLATGLINGWYMVGPHHLSGLWTSDYGRLLTLKLVAFGGMLALAARNRFRLSPRLSADLARGASPGDGLSALRKSIGIEFALGLVALAAVAWLGTLVPPAAGG